MDWIEQLFGIDPDMSSGSLELLVAGAVVLVIAGTIASRWSRRALGEAGPLHRTPAEPTHLRTDPRPQTPGGR